MALQEKEAKVSELKQSFAQAQAAFVVDYTRCTCVELKGIRNKLRGSGARMAVVKNTLSKLAIKGGIHEGLEQFLSGPTAIIWADKDPVEPAKILFEFSKTKETFQIKGGSVDGALASAKDVQMLAGMPSKAELQAKLLSVFNAPAIQLLRVLNAPAVQLLRLLDAWRQELEKKAS